MTWSEKPAHFVLVWRGIVFWHAGIIYNAFGVGYRCNCIWAAGKRCGFYLGENPRRLIMRPILLLCTAGLSSAAPASDATVRLRPPTSDPKNQGIAGTAHRTNEAQCLRYQPLLKLRCGSLCPAIWFRLSWLRYHASAAAAFRPRFARRPRMAMGRAFPGSLPAQLLVDTAGRKVARKHLWWGLRSILRIYCRAEAVVPHPWRRSSDPRSAL